MTVTIPLWAAIIVPMCTGLLGFFTCAALVVGRDADGGEA